METALSFHERLRLAKRGAMAITKGKAQVAAKPKAIKPAAAVKPARTPIPAKVKVAKVKAPKAPANQYKPGHVGRDKIFKTRPLNLDELTEVRIDERTTIYVRPGKDINAAIEKIKNRPSQYEHQKI